MGFLKVKCSARFCLLFLKLLSVQTKNAHKGTFFPPGSTMGTKATKFGTRGSFCSKLEHKVPFYVIQKEQMVPLLSF